MISNNHQPLFALGQRTWHKEYNFAVESQKYVNIQTAFITLDTDKPSYVTGEDVEFSGSIGNATEGQTATTSTSNTAGPLGDGKIVRIDVCNPRGGVHASDTQARVDDSGLYSSRFSTTYPEAPAGEYTATATYNGQVAKVKFTIVPSLT